MAQYKGKQLKDKSNICELQDTDMFDNVLAGAVSLLCYLHQGNLLV